MTTETKPNGKPGRKPSNGDRRRYLYAFTLQRVAPTLGDDTALKRACMIHPDGLPKVVQASLKKLHYPSDNGQFMTADHLEDPEQAALLKVIERLRKTYKKHKNDKHDALTLMRAADLISFREQELRNVVSSPD